MSMRYKGGFIQEYFDPLSSGAGWTQYSGAWTRQTQMQAAGANNWPGVYLGDGLYGWGYNNQAQLGLGSINAYSGRSLPAQVGSLTTWLNITGGFYFSAATKTDGTLWTWGYNDYGQLGQNNKINRSSPVQVGTNANWSNIAAGATHLAAIKSTGSLWLCGNNDYGQLGTGNNVPRSSPTQVGALTTWSKVSCGFQHTLAIKTDGTVWSWGRNNEGQLGRGNTTSANSPVQVGSLTTWLTISAGAYFSLATKADGTLWGWGYNGNNQLTRDYPGNRSSPVQIGTDTNWSIVSGGSNFTQAIKTTGTLWSWGTNNSGQLGRPSLGPTEDGTITQVGALTDWAAVACHNQGAAAKRTGGSLWTYGIGNFGAIGDNNISSRSSPVQVDTSTNWVGINTGSYAYHVLATQKKYVPG